MLAESAGHYFEVFFREATGKHYGAQVYRALADACEYFGKFVAILWKIVETHPPGAVSVPAKKLLPC